MARIKRVVVPGYPHHIVQRGVRSLDIFLREEDRTQYLRLLKEQGERCGVVFLAYCLMTNHVHLLAVPEKTDSLAQTIGEAHRLYTRMINFREQVRGFLFQGRFYSCPVATDEYLIAAIQYIVRNPVRAKLVRVPWEYPWSSAAFHCGLIEEDPLVVPESRLLPEDVDWRKLFGVDPAMQGLLEEKNRTGRPFGPDSFHAVVKKITGRDTRPGRPGRPRKNSKMSPEKK